jgi:hypothetical protein
MENNKTALHVHDDVEILTTAKNRFGGHFFIGRYTEVYIMQEDKVVFVGSRINAINFINNNEGNICKSL